MSPKMHSAEVSTIYLFNLVVGAGALALPLAFALTGWRNKQANGDIEHTLSHPDLIVNCEEASLLPDQSSQVDPDAPCYNIKDKMEMGQMAKLLFNRIGINLFYIVIALYLYGDLAIYAAAVPKSLTRVLCMHVKPSNNSTSAEDLCFKSISKEGVYRLNVLAFTLVLGPFVFFDLGKTKYMQIATTVLRWLAFILMIALALYGIERHKNRGNAPVFNLSKLPNFFGVSVYSFMCQHSLPSILTPTKQKNRMNMILTTSYSAISAFYLLLTLTAVFCFPVEKLNDIYTLNFLDSWPGFAYFLALFPVFTLSSNFPIIAITLRENIKSIFQREGKSCSAIVDRIVFPLVTILPPIAVAFVTQDVEMLVGVTGSYAGSIIQYVIPVTLVFCGRKQARKLFGSYVNKHRSIFRHRWWIFFVIVWTVLCIGLVTVQHFLDLFDKN
eukprot:gene9080-16731_t